MRKLIILIVIFPTLLQGQIDKYENTKEFIEQFFPVAEFGKHTYAKVNGQYYPLLHDPMPGYGKLSSSTQVLKRYKDWVLMKDDFVAYAAQNPDVMAYFVILEWACNQYLANTNQNGRLYYQPGGSGMQPYEIGGLIPQLGHHNLKFSYWSPRNCQDGGRAYVCGHTYAYSNTSVNVTNYSELDALVRECRAQILKAEKEFYQNKS